ncbi:MAG: hypothetical protein HLUCCA11_01410 [Phormidesmis priestleyi Ana]|uniref:Uncharacterized protein n=1 Tax=Phormidesmis priestleyi Ana TaxID=1666911 RepID=A0A0P8DLD7_9CYAN|nr:MAG: hypothetical protein HLUCCA11_01410 [Phormidesmis priestleyi Ana]
MSNHQSIRQSKSIRQSISAIIKRAFALPIGEAAPASSANSRPRWTWTPPHRRPKS